MRPPERSEADRQAVTLDYNSNMQGHGHMGECRVQINTDFFTGHLGLLINLTLVKSMRHAGAEVPESGALVSAGRTL